MNAPTMTEALRFALECIDGRIGLTENSLFAWSKSDRPEARERILGIEREAGRQRTMRAALVAALAGDGRKIDVMKIVGLCHEIIDAGKRSKHGDTMLCAEAARRILNELRNPPAMDATREGGA